MILPLYSANPSVLNWFMKKSTRDLLFGTFRQTHVSNPPILTHPEPQRPRVCEAGLPGALGPGMETAQSFPAGEHFRLKPRFAWNFSVRVVHAEESVFLFAPLLVLAGIVVAFAWKSLGPKVKAYFAEAMRENPWDYVHITTWNFLPFLLKRVGQAPASIVEVLRCSRWLCWQRLSLFSGLRPG